MPALNQLFKPEPQEEFAPQETDAMDEFNGNVNVAKRKFEKEGRKPTELDEYFEDLAKVDPSLARHTLLTVQCPAHWGDQELFALILKPEGAVTYLRQHVCRIEVAARFSKAMAGKTKKCALVVYADTPPANTGPNTPLAINKFNVDKELARSLRAALARESEKPKQLGVRVPVEGECRRCSFASQREEIKVALVSRHYLVSQAIGKSRSLTELQHHLYSVFNDPVSFCFTILWQYLSNPVAQIPGSMPIDEDNEGTRPTSKRGGWLAFLSVASLASAAIVASIGYLFSFYPIHSANISVILLLGFIIFAKLTKISVRA